MEAEVSAQVGTALHEQAEAFGTRSLEGAAPYVWLDAIYEKVRRGGHVRSMAVVFAIGVTADGARTVLGLGVGNSEEEAFRTEFLRDPVRRGLDGVQLVISDARAGLKKAIRKVRVGVAARPDEGFGDRLEEALAGEDHGGFQSKQNSSGVHRETHHLTRHHSLPIRSSRPLPQVSMILLVTLYSRMGRFDAVEDPAAATRAMT